MILAQNKSLRLHATKLNPRPCGSQQAILLAILSADGQPIRPARVSTFSAMDGGVTKTRTRRSRATPSKAVQAKLLDAAADEGAGQLSTSFAEVDNC